MTNRNYRVVGIRSDGSRKVLVDRISKQLAEDTLKIIPSGVFVKLLIEADESNSGPESLDLSGTNRPGDLR